MFADRARIFIRSGKGGDGNTVPVMEKKAQKRNVPEQAEKI